MIQKIKKPHATVVVIFGAVGDLSQRKLAPALYNLFLDNWLPKNFALIGVSYHDHSDNSLRELLKAGVAKHGRRGLADSEKWEEFSKKIRYVKADFTDEAAYPQLAEDLNDIDSSWKTKANRIFYLSVAPRFFETISVNIKEARAAAEPDRTRIVIEKPFGRDLESAEELNAILTKYFRERQLYRIDHYLGKETVQNILAFRFANSIFEPLWNNNYIDHVQITVAENTDVGNRGGYYDSSGALRDMVQNHLLQLMCMAAMEPPVTYEADDIRNRKVDVLKSIRMLDNPHEIDKNSVRAQYTAGTVKGREVIGYADADKVKHGTTTETFVALRLLVDNWRWKGVPFYVRTGKALPEKNTVIHVVFKPVVHQLFPCEVTEESFSNTLSIGIQPDTYIRLKLHSKHPGLEMRIDPTFMEVNYKEAYDTPTPEAYETLLLDVMEGDATLFMRIDEVEAAWKIIDPILKHWEESKEQLPKYQAGSNGPTEAEDLLGDKRNWIN